MAKIPRVPSKSETHARVRCQAEEKHLSAIKQELDKLWHTQSRFLGTHRTRFVLDRRRSLGNVYNSQIDGIQPHRRIRRRRRGSAPEVIDIFNRQEHRRQSVKVIEKAVSRDAMRRLDRKYREALARNAGSDADEGEVPVAPDADTEGPGVEERGYRKAKKTGKIKAEAAEPSTVSHTTEQLSTATTHTANRVRKKGTRYGSRHDADGEDSSDTTSDSVAHDDDVNRSDVTKPKAPSPAVRTEPVPQRKRSYSDGNIFLNIMELESAARHPLSLIKATAAARSGERDSGDVTRSSFQNRTFVVESSAGELSSSQSLSSSASPNDEASSGEDSDVSDSSYWTARRPDVKGVCFDSSSPDDVTPLRPRRQPDASLPPHDAVTRLQPRMPRPRGGSYPRVLGEDVHLSPSLRRRLASVDLASPVHLPHTRPNAAHSPPSPSSMTRPRPDLGYPSPNTTRHTDAAATGRDSLPRRKKEDRPKRIYQQGPVEKAAAGRKRRPLRRSRSETEDISALLSLQERAGLGGETARRGSDSLQGLLRTTPTTTTTPRSDQPTPRRPTWRSLALGLALSPEEKEDIARHKRKELVASLRKRQQEVDGDVSRRIRTFLQRYDDA